MRLKIAVVLAAVWTVFLLGPAVLWFAEPSRSPSALAPWQNLGGIAAAWSAIALFVIYRRSRETSPSAGKSSGTFTLTVGGKTTEPIPFDASIEQIEAAARRAGLSVGEILMRQH